MYVPHSVVPVYIIAKLSICQEAFCKFFKKISKGFFSEDFAGMVYKKNKLCYTIWEYTTMV